jgi:uncharacterized protein YjiS (DUF1127 family)
MTLGPSGLVRLKEVIMNHANRVQSFGTLFSTLAALTSPAQEFVTSRPAYGGVPRLRLREPAGQRLKAALRTMWRRYERARVKHALERLDDRLLRDIGVTRAEVDAGLLPPFARPEEISAGRNASGRW